MHPSNKNPGSPQARTWWLAGLVALLLLSCWLRTYNLEDESLWFDEASTARNLIIPFSQVIGEAQSLGHGPYYLLLRLLPNLEATEFSLRYPSALFGVLGVAAVAAVGRRLFDHTGGVLAALLLALSPFHVWHSREARTYSWTLAMTLLAVAAYLDLWPKRRQHTWWRLVAAQTISLYAHLFTLLANVWQTLFVLVQALRKRFPWRVRDWLLSQLVAILLATPTFGLALWSATQKSQISWVKPPTYFAPLGLTMQFSGVRFLGEYDWWWGVWALWLALVIWGVVKQSPAVFSPGEGRILLLSWGLLPPAVLLLLSWLLKPAYLDRYLLFTLPTFTLLIAAGVAACKRNVLIWLSLAALMAGQVVAIHEVLGSPMHAKPDWRAAQSALAAQVQEDDLVVFSPWLLQRPFDYYNQRYGGVPAEMMVTVGEPQGAEVVPEDVLVSEIERIEAQALSRGGRLWVVERSSGAASRWLAIKRGWQQLEERQLQGGLWITLLAPGESG